MELQGPDETSPVLQPLQSLTRLVGLQLNAPSPSVGAEWCVTASMLSAAHHLTRLELMSCNVEPGALAGKTQLQHLYMRGPWRGAAAGFALLLSHLQHMQQLTSLCLDDRLTDELGDTVPASAYSALTASSNLRELDIYSCTLPADVWQHMFPAGRLLPHLHQLDLVSIKQPSGGAIPVPEGSRLVSCCPALRVLDMGHLQYSAELLAPLQGLEGLQKVRLCVEDSTGEDSPAGSGLEVVGQLTQLRDLDVIAPNTEELLLQLTQLQHLTNFHCYGPKRGRGHTRIFIKQVIQSSQAVTTIR
jgi:hypothetical protein